MSHILPLTAQEVEERLLKLNNITAGATILEVAQTVNNKIRVDVDYAIENGTEIKFRSPVDCSAITGLVVYYLNESNVIVSKEFAFADAHGNNVGDIDHLFAENAVVKVILDTNRNMAFVQNADTNAYLEGRLNELDNVFFAVAGQDGANYSTFANARYDKLCVLLYEFTPYILAGNDSGGLVFYHHDTKTGDLDMLRMNSRNSALTHSVIRHAKTVNGIEADENGNIEIESAPTEWNDIQNKPFGTFSDIQIAPADILSCPKLDVGNYYKVSDVVLTWEDFKDRSYWIQLLDDGTEITLEGFGDGQFGNDGGIITNAVMDPDHSINFLITGADGNTFCAIKSYPENVSQPAGTYFLASPDNSDTNVLSLKIDGFDRFTTVKTIPPEYLPDDFGSSSVPSWNEIPGNPFGGGCSTVSWASAGIDFNTLPPITWVKVSDAVITMEDFEDVTNEDHFITWISHWEEESQIMCNLDATDFRNAILDNGDGTVSIYIVDGMGNMVDSVRFTPDGVFFYTGDDWDYKAYPLSVTVPRARKFESFKTIDSKYLPEGSRTETVSLSQTLTYGTLYNDTDMWCDRQKIVKEKWFGAARMVSDANISVKSCNRHSDWYTLGEGENEFGQYLVDAQEIENGFYKLVMTDENGNVMDFGYCATDDSDYDIGLYLFDWGGGTFTCYAGAVFEVRTPKPIDKKYLPDDIGISEELLESRIADTITTAVETSAEMLYNHVPLVSAADNGKILRVMDGAWAAVEVQDPMGEVFITVEDIDSICGASITYARLNEGAF